MRTRPNAIDVCRRYKKLSLADVGCLYGVSRQDAAYLAAGKTGRLPQWDKLAPALALGEGAVGESPLWLLCRVHLEGPRPLWLSDASLGRRLPVLHNWRRAEQTAATVREYVPDALALRCVAVPAWPSFVAALIVAELGAAADVDRTMFVVDATVPELAAASQLHVALSVVMHLLAELHSGAQWARFDEARELWAEEGETS